ncbi:Photosystem II protein PsbT, partial [uncultured Microcoleus sp.]
GKCCLHFDSGFSHRRTIFCDRLSGTSPDWQI